MSKTSYIKKFAPLPQYLYSGYVTMSPEKFAALRPKMDVILVMDKEQRSGRSIFAKTVLAQWMIDGATFHPKDDGTQYVKMPYSKKHAPSNAA